MTRYQDEEKCCLLVLALFALAGLFGLGRPEDRAGSLGLLILSIFGIVYVWVMATRREEARSEQSERELVKQNEIERRAEVEAKMRARREQERRVVFGALSARLKASAEYSLIESFVRRYEHADFFPDSEVDRLLDLLASKKYEFTREELTELLGDEHLEQEYLWFKRQLFHEFGSDSSLAEILRRYVEIFGGENVESSIYRLRRALVEEGFADVSEAELLHSVRLIKQSLEREYFERSLRESAPPQLPIGGFEFQSFLARLFERMGYHVQETKLTGDQGADLLLMKFGVKTVVQAKRYAGVVGNAAVQEALAAKAFYRADTAMVITTATFTRAAIELAETTGVSLVDGSQLSKWIAQFS